MSDNNLQPNSDPNVGFKVPDGEVGDFFPLEREQPPSDTFEIGLALGGTVSAGTYTAGVLDFLIQALDAWTAAKNASDLSAPKHKVIIKIMCGTSGGGVNAVLLSRALAYAFPHYDPASRSAPNPLHDVWVEGIDIHELLKTEDLDGAKQVSSLLCAKCIDRAAVLAGSYEGQPLGTLGTPPVRDYVERLLPVVVTLTNLRGVPYSTNFRSAQDRKEFYTDRADHIRFRVDVTGKAPPAPGNLQPYETGISNVPSNVTKPWSVIVNAARGTSAFPVGLPPAVIERNVEHYRYRYAVIDALGERKAVWMMPEWPYLIAEGFTKDDPYKFLCVDGGCFNNEPVNFAREWLAGVIGTNPRGGSEAHRAVILVDPFADAAAIGPVSDEGMLSTAFSTIGAFSSGARYQTADLSLFTDKDVYSRFLVNPVRKDPSNPAGNPWTGGEAIAASGLAAFMGFMCRDFREHDFLLGRLNCQSFLRKHFTLKPDNKLFDGWTPDQKKQFMTDDGDLPVIPLVGTAAIRLQAPDWPKNKFDPESIRSLIDKRLEKVAGMEASPLLAGLCWPFPGLVVKGLQLLGGKATGWIVDMIKKELKKTGLIA